MQTILGIKKESAPHERACVSNYLDKVQLCEQEAWSRGHDM